jgi:hypothetical protein
MKSRMKICRSRSRALTLCISYTMAMTACSAQPAMAGRVEAAAYYSAASACKALSLGLPQIDAVRWGLKENATLWGAYMQDQLFAPLMIQELFEQCPAAMRRDEV